jgi:hypothetical protein
VNEIQLIRAQLATERSRVSTVTSTCAAAGATAQLRAAGLGYLRCVLNWFEARDQRLSELMRARPGVSESGRLGLEAALAQPGTSRAALAKLTAIQAIPGGVDSAAAPPAWAALAHFLGTAWGPRRDTIDALLAAITRPADWRTIAGLDADSILEERQHFAQVRAACPAGASLSEDLVAGARC